MAYCGEPRAFSGIVALPGRECKLHAVFLQKFLKSIINAELITGIYYLYIFRLI